MECDATCIYLRSSASVWQRSFVKFIETHKASDSHLILSFLFVLPSPNLKLPDHFVAEIFPLLGALYWGKRAYSLWYDEGNEEHESEKTNEFWIIKCAGKEPTRLSS